MKNESVTYAHMVIHATDILGRLESQGVEPRVAAGVMAVGLCLMCSDKDQVFELISAAYDDMDEILAEEKTEDERLKN